jgi:hypothetical protein
MDFATKLAQTRAYTTENQNGVDAQEVYDEAILQAIEKTNPASNSQIVQASNYSVGTYYLDEFYYSISITFSNDFAGTFQGANINPNTIINLTAKTTLDIMTLVVTAGSVLVIIIFN